MNDNELLSYNQLGLIPGPKEKKEDFFLRASYSLNIQSKIPSSSFNIDIALEDAENIYDISPKWVPVLCEKKGLFPWHGGSSWIFQLKETDPLCALIQLHPHCRWKKADEIALHELCHIGRLAFQEPKFEEVIAYRSSKSSFSKYLGGLIQNKIESLLFVIVISLILIIDIYLLFNGTLEQMITFTWLKLIPAFMLLYVFIRNFILQRQFDSALKNLQPFFNRPMAVIYRLTDKEIIQFSKWKKDKIKNYIDNQESLRWKVIRLSYSFNSNSIVTNKLDG